MHLQFTGPITRQRQEVINRLGFVANLPQEFDRRFAMEPGEVVRYVLEGPGNTLYQLKAVQDWVLTRLLKQVPGVIDVTGFGGMVKEYQVLLDARLMKQYGVTMKQVEDAIEGANANVGGNILTLGSQAHNVRTLGLFGEGIDSLDPAVVSQAAVLQSQKIEDINRVVVTTLSDGAPIYVKHIAKP